MPKIHITNTVPLKALPMIQIFEPSFAFTISLCINILSLSLQSNEVQPDKKLSRKNLPT